MSACVSPVDLSRDTLRADGRSAEAATANRFSRGRAIVRHGIGSGSVIWANRKRLFLHDASTHRAVFANIRNLSPLSPPGVQRWIPTPISRLASAQGHLRATIALGVRTKRS